MALKSESGGVPFAQMNEIGAMAEQLAAAVELTMNPNASQAERLEAYNACEVFKEKSPFCIQCGLYLAQRPHYSQFVRHFGLQLMEHCIKYRWYNLNHGEKLFIKENAMKLVECGMDSLLEDEAHMRDVLSRVVVEMIKREWPQQWGTLLAELNECSSKGCVQTELVLHVLLRLVEDVAVLQNLESIQRRKDLYQALTLNMADLFTFFRGLIEKHYELYQSNLGNLPVANSHARVVLVVLLTLSGFVEWVSMVHIMAEEGRLLQILCLLLNNEIFQDGAAECLLQIVSRKGKVEERRPLLILFSEDAMRCIFQAADTSVHKNYQFLKKLTRVLTSLGTQLCSLWSKETEPRPPNFEMYLEAIVTFTRHSSLSLVYYANSLWISLMKHEQISKDDVFLSFVPKWVEAAGPKILKVRYPSSKSNVEPNTPEAYAVMDYDAEDEFNGFFHRFRVELVDTFKQATLVSPLVTYSYVERWLGAQIQKTVTHVNTEVCSQNSLSYLEWDACSVALDAVLGKLVMAKERPDVASGLSLLDLCIALEPTDPLVLSAILSCISALFVFLSMAPPETTAFYLPRVLDKIFATLVFTLPGEPKNQRSRGVKNLRRHAASLMIKIAQKYPLLLLPVFSRIHSIVASLQSKPHTLSTMEAICLQEALLLISNHLCDYERQCKFIGEVITPISQPWLSLTNSAFVSTSAFMSYVGLDKPPVEPSTDDTNGQNRSQIMWCLDVMMAVVKRCMWPSDPELAARGGFLVCTTGVGNPIYRNPATPHVLPLLPGLLALSNVLNGLSTPPAMAQISEGYKGAYLMLEVEKQNLLGIGCGSSDTMGSDTKGETTPLQRMQNFISSVHDDVSHTLANAFHSLAHDIYHVQNLALSLTNSVLTNLEYVPDYRLRVLVRVFMKSLVTSCPVTCYDSVLLPVLAHFTPYMYTRLTARWQHLSELNENGSLDEENKDTQEMLEDMLNRTLTREYLDVLKVLLYGVMESEETEVKPPQQSEAISELGVKVLQFDTTCHAVTLCLLSALSWADSTASLKSTGLVGGVISFLVQNGKVGPELAAHTISAVLLGLQQHGQHDANLGSLLVLGTLLYGILRPIAPNIPQVMKQIPDVSVFDLQKLDDRMMKEVQKGNKVDKAKKEMFKKVTSPLIGQNMGQLFRKKVAMRDLPRLDNNKQKLCLDPLASNENGLSSLFRM
ncbi:exportin-5 [Cimex lectularius]|uniref:Exportin-5 n=1 Tax=Cimex lectularius TaxID=79782 RepID=A0A8I6RDD8_CIMLE|nr:exportin-5 [Cimex lectularius]